MIEPEAPRLPPNWASVPLSEMVTPNRPRHQPREYPGLPFLGMEHVEPHSTRILGTVPASTMKSSAVHFMPGDVLYGRLRPYLNKVAQPEFEGLCSAEFIVFPPSEVLDSKYLKYLLNSTDFVSYASHLNEGDRPRVDFSQLGGYRVPVPPLPEQRRIVAEIETQFTRLDAAVAALKRARANLERYRGSLFRAAVSGRLTTKHTDFDGNETLPDSWRWAGLTEMGTIGRGKSKHRPRNDPRLLGGPYPFIQTGDVGRSGGYIREYSSTYSELGLSQSKLWPEGTLCITIAANIAGTGILTFPACFPDSIVGFVRDGDPWTVRYVDIFFRATRSELERYAPATAQKNINLAILERLRIPFPPFEELKQIVEELERQLSVIEALATTIDADLKRAERMRHSLLEQAFAGQLVSQNSDDEPASQLLERIQAERILYVSAKKSKTRARGQTGNPKAVQHVLL